MDKLLKDMYTLIAQKVNIKRSLTVFQHQFQKMLLKNYRWKEFLADNAELEVWSDDKRAWDIDYLDGFTKDNVKITLLDDLRIDIKNKDTFKDWGSDGSVGWYRTEKFESIPQLLEVLEKYKKRKYKYYTGNIVPDNETVFVFGSNPEGRHGAGSAKHAMQKFGAVYGKGYGYYGQSYAIATTDLRLPSRPNVSIEEIVRQIKEMYEFATKHPEKKFKIAYRNDLQKRTLCGYSGYYLMDMFLNKSGEVPSNIYFSEEWYNNIDYVLDNPVSYE